MKTITKVFLVATVGGFLSLSAFAGPGAQYFQRRAESTAAVTKPANDGTVLACEHMLARNTGPTANRIPRVSAECTPEMLKNDRECQSACGVPLATATVPTQVTCEHMLTYKTGYHRIPFMSVDCTPEMLANDPECQSACQRGT